MPKTEISTNWYVITGGPSTGKTKVIEYLAFLGHCVRPEAARIHIDNEMSKGKTLEQVRGDERAFQQEVLELKLESEAVAPTDTLIFWDRGMPDSVVYSRRYGVDALPALEASRLRRYRQIFLLDMPAQYQSDYCRTEGAAEAVEIHTQLENCYREMGYSIVRVPLIPIHERAKMILELAGIPKR
jgi:predicted ATPase